MGVVAQAVTRLSCRHHRFSNQAFGVHRPELVLGDGVDVPVLMIGMIEKGADRAVNISAVLGIDPLLNLGDVRSRIRGSVHFERHQAQIENRILEV